MIVKDTTEKSINIKSVKNLYGSEKPPKDLTDFIVIYDINN